MSWEHKRTKAVKRIERKEQEWQIEKDLLQRESKIKQEKQEFAKSNKMSTSKKLILFLFINCTIIELFTIFVTLKSFTLAAATGLAVDFTPLVTLIGAIVGEVIGFAIYSLKAVRENCQGGIIYDQAMQQYIEDNDEEPKG